MKDLKASLTGNFTIVNLGCIGDADFTLPDTMLKTLTVVEADVEGGAATTNLYHKKISIQQPVAGKKGKHLFRRNGFAGTCSLLEPLPGVVEKFGMENYCNLIERIEMECDTLPNLLQMHGITTLDFLKTDIEGLDHEIIRSCEGFLGRTHFIQCELRFRPFYQSEPYFHEIVNLLAGHGYEVLDLLHIDRWKYRTPHRNFQMHGCAQWADFLFVLKPDALADAFGNDLPVAVAKQIILACMLNKKNYAEYLLYRFKNCLPESWFQELERLTHPRFPKARPLLHSLRDLLRPIELFLKHRIGKSEFVALR